MNSSQGLHRDYLHKKEKKGKWVLFWVILNDNHMLFYESKKRQQLVGQIQIGMNTKCVVSTKTKTHIYPFTVCAVHGRHLFKCQTSVERHQWMTAIHHASRLLHPASSPVLVQTNQNVLSEMPCYQATEENPSISDDESHDEPLPSNVLRVTSALSSDSPSRLPLRIRDKTHLSDVNTDKGKPVDIASKVSIFPYARESPHVISNSEREQISALNLSSHSPLAADLNPLCATDSSGSTRNRCFASTPEMGKQSYLVRPRSLSTSSSKAFNFIPSSDSLCASNMRFSRHMVSGNDVLDMES